MITDLDAASRATLESAAARLYSLGRHPGGDLPSSARLNCLTAASYLADTGAALITVPVEHCARTLADVLDELAALPPRVFADEAVLEAAAAARTAMARLEDGA